MAVVLKKCNCRPQPSHAADYQDEKYGEGMRVCNESQDKKDAVCTVCGKSHSLK